MSPDLLDPKLFYPCGGTKPQPVTLKENLDHYRTCDDARCKERLAKFDEVRRQMGYDLKKGGF